MEPDIGAGIGEADLEWISLGHASNSDIEALFGKPEEPALLTFQTRNMTGEIAGGSGHAPCLRMLK